MVKIGSIIYSTNKHESDIPQIETGDVLVSFLRKRQQSLIVPEVIDQPIDNTLVDDPKAVISKLLLIERSLNSGNIDDLNLDYLFKLEKKFVLYGVIHTHYSEQMKPISDINNLPDIYCKLALLLLKLSNLNNDLNALNSAIRLVDKCCELIKQGHNMLNRSDLAICLEMEHVILMRLVSNG